VDPKALVEVDALSRRHPFAKFDDLAANVLVDGETSGVARWKSKLSAIGAVVVMGLSAP